MLFTEFTDSLIIVALILASVYLFGSLIFLYTKSFKNLNSKNILVVNELNSNVQKNIKTSYLPLMILFFYLLFVGLLLTALSFVNVGSNLLSDVIFIFLFSIFFFIIAYGGIFYFKKILKKENTSLDNIFFSAFLSFFIILLLFFFNQYLHLYFIFYLLNLSTLFLDYLTELLLPFSHSKPLIFILFLIIPFVILPVLILFLFSILFFAIIDLREKEKRKIAIIKIIIWFVVFTALEIIISYSGASKLFL